MPVVPAAGPLVAAVVYAAVGSLIGGGTGARVWVGAAPGVAGPEPGGPEGPVSSEPSKGRTSAVAVGTANGSEESG